MFNESRKQEHLHNLPEITAEELKIGGLELEFPELYELKEVIENNRSHNKDSVFNHTVLVLKNLEILLEKYNQNDHFSGLIAGKSKKQLFTLATLLHDVGKKETMVVKEEKTSCLDHESVGAAEALEILKRFDLSSMEKEYISQIISNHGRLHNLLDRGFGENFNSEYQKLKEEISEIIREILLLTLADIMGGDLKDNLPDQYNSRVNFIEQKIEENV